MARPEKNQPPPIHAIEAPSALTPLMQAFHVDSEKAAKALISEAAQAIYASHDLLREQIISQNELDGIISFMKGLAPKDALETLYAAQIVVGHMLGMRKLANNFMEDQKLGLNLLRFSNEALERLEKKRSSRTQNITVNYNHSGGGQTLMQTVIQEKGT